MTEANFPVEYEFNDGDSSQDLSLEESTNDNATSKSKQNNINWHKLAHKLREHNRKLLKKVFHLEQEIIESNQALEEQQEISRTNDLYASKQAQKINQYQEEIAQLLQKVDKYQQQTYVQQSTIGSLNQQLETSQQKASELAKECAQLQKSNNEKSYELLHQREELQQLNSRISRQQSLVQQPSHSHNSERVGNKPIEAWSANYVEPETSLVTEAHLVDEDWSTAEKAKKRSVNSISAVKLPRFPRRQD